MFMRALTLIILGVIILMLGACLQKTETPPEETSEAASQEAAGDQKILFAVCEGCHGDNGAGGTGIAPALQNNEWIRNADLQEIKKVIREGRDYSSKRYPEYASTMPSWKDTYSEEEIELLAKYVKSLAK